MTVIYCSTTGAGNKSAFEIAKNLIKHGIKDIELSGGCYSENQLEQIEGLQRIANNLVIHNYFPIPKKSFVLNLASPNLEILNNSIAFCKRGIEISSQLRTRIYGIHSGFLMDPKPEELGGAFQGNLKVDRDSSLATFKESVIKLYEYSKKLNVQLLLENNVSNKLNYEIHQKDIFLLTNPKEIQEFFNEIPKEIKLLLDTGHLKVSANTLGFSIIDALRNLDSLIGGYHLSENSGFSDDHSSFTIDNWALKDFIRKDVNYYTLEFKAYNLKTINDEVRKILAWLT